MKKLILLLVLILVGCSSTSGSNSNSPAPKLREVYTRHSDATLVAACGATAFPLDFSLRAVTQNGLDITGVIDTSTEIFNFSASYVEDDRSFKGTLDIDGKFEIRLLNANAALTIIKVFFEAPYKTVDVPYPCPTHPKKYLEYSGELIGQ